MSVNTGPHREDTRGISWGFVAAQVVGYSLLVWALTFLLALGMVAFGDRTFSGALCLSALIMVVLVLASGMVGAAGTPIPLLDGLDRLLRPFGGISRSQDRLLRPFRTSNKDVEENERRNGLTALGLALVIVPQLVLVATLVDSSH